MAVGVVDLLEPVEIDVEEGASAHAFGEMRELLVDLVAQQGAVRKPAQRVVVGEVAAVCLGLPELGDVGDDRDEQRYAVADMDQPLARYDRADVALGVGELLFVLVFAAGGEDKVVDRPEDLRLLARDEGEVGLADQLLLWMPHELAHRVVHDHPPVLPVLDEHGTGDHVDDLLKRLEAAEYLVGRHRLAVPMCGVLRHARRRASILQDPIHWRGCIALNATAQILGKSE